ncbi:MAG: hypothetical protein RMY34_13860 [Aulosira sp. DedQUE10]|nr:hypothetical protein [Aulosira sp. DedQUE10]
MQLETLPTQPVAKRNSFSRTERSFEQIVSLNTPVSWGRYGKDTFTDFANSVCDRNYLWEQSLLYYWLG